MGNILVTGVSDLDRMELGEMGMKPSTVIALLSPHLRNTLFSSPRSKSNGATWGTEVCKYWFLASLRSCVITESEKYL